jgi:hypothetical protein
MLFLVCLIWGWYSRQHLEKRLRKMPLVSLYGVVGGILFLICGPPFLLCFGPTLNTLFCCRLEKEAIDGRYLDFYENIDEGAFNVAYNSMSPYYQQTHTIEEFQRDFAFLCDPGCWELHPTRSLRLTDNKAYLYPSYFTFTLFRGGPEFELEKIEGNWYLTGNYEWYIDGGATRNSNWQR